MNNSKNISKRLGIVYDVLYSKLSDSNEDVYDYLPVVTQYSDADDGKTVKLWELYDKDFYGYLNDELSSYPEISSQLLYLTVNDSEEEYHNAVEKMGEEKQRQLLKYMENNKISREDVTRKIFEMAYGDELLNHSAEMELFIRGEEIDKEKIFSNVIDIIGLDNYKSLVQNYNNVIISAINSGNYPTNDEILSGKPFGYKAFVNTSKSL